MKKIVQLIAYTCISLSTLCGQENAEIHFDTYQEGQSSGTTHHDRQEQTFWDRCYDID